jgi:hypothetical protein
MEPNPKKQGLDPDTTDPETYDPNGWGTKEDEQAPEPPKRGNITRSGWITLSIEDDF